uniref:Protein kinase putative n=1 Tax=Albugo laibachii Nc14 TaxID=890382 RepID=F0WI00_9STRA|nr:protein kinase putative [Albugo laibachii Nc14]|eukprot:CCA20877.1 protein kinase putative [Albugo laibachii Nc14]
MASVGGNGARLETSRSGVRFGSKGTRRRGSSQDDSALTLDAQPGSSLLDANGYARNSIAVTTATYKSSPSFSASSNARTEIDTGYVPSKTGLLTKRAMSSMGAFANWKERFFVLAEGHLSYYKQGGGFFTTAKDDVAHLKGELQLTSDSLVRKCLIDDRANCFEIWTPSKKMFAQAATAKEVEDWIKSIRAHINALKRNQTRGSFQDPSTSSSALNVTVAREDYTRPSMLEEHEIVRGADKSSEPKDVVIKQLLEENRQLRELVATKDQYIHELETNGGRANLDTASVVPGGISSGSARTGRTAVPKLILDLRDLKNKQIQLFDAAEVGNWHLIATLLSDNIVDVNGVGINQTTALHAAAQKNHSKAVKELITRGADHTVRNGDSLTPLHVATQAGNLECVEELVNAGADPNMTDCQGNAAIHMSAEIANIAIAKKLIAAGAKTDVANASGSLPVHLSPIGHPVRVLLGSGANLAATNPSQPPKSTTVQETDMQVRHIAFKNKYQKDLALGPRDFEFVKVLGRGAFAKVYLVRGKGSNRDQWYALKAYNKQAIVQKNQAQYIHTEKAALQACSDHPYIVTLYYAFQSKDRLFLVMEYCGGGDLLSALTRRKAFTEAEAAFYIGEIVLALSHLHSKNIVFRDLKPENVVMDLDGHCLLTDFGISKEGIKDHTSANTFCGSPMYLAPEMLSRSGHGFALDWYSVGALLFELLTGLPPFYTNDKKQLFHNILRGHLVIPDYLSPNARDLIQRLLHRDPAQRLGSGKLGDAEIFEHPFFSVIDWGKLRKRELAPPFRPKTAVDPTGIPDTSNFPQAFTDQEISDIERGFNHQPNSSVQQLQRNNSDRRLFSDFDFLPELNLDPDAKQFEQMALDENSYKNLPTPDLAESVEEVGI